MERLASVTVLHVSDIQFGKNHRFFQHDPQTPDDSFDTLLSRILEDVRELKDEQLQPLRPDLAVLTGDLAEWGSPSEFAHVTQFVEGLCKGLGLTRDRAVLVPGNHDINRKSCEAYFNDCDANEMKPQFPYWQKWRFFTECFTQFYREHPAITFTKDQPYTFFTVPDLKLVIAGLNSTMAESHQDATHYGEIGEAQVRWFAEQIDSYRDQGWMRLAVLHHNIRRGPVQDDENLRDADLLANHLRGRVNAVFHGHTHDGKLDWWSNRVPIFSTGSAAVRSDARPAEVPAQYQIVRLDPDGFTVFTRAYAPNQRRWIGDTRIGDGNNWFRSELVKWDRVESTFPSPGPALPDSRPPSGRDAEELTIGSIDPAVVRDYRHSMVRLHQYTRFSELAGRADDGGHRAVLLRLPLFVPQRLRALSSSRDQEESASVQTGQKSPPGEASIGLEQILIKQPVALLLGGPGSGKSELTYWMLLKLCTDQHEGGADCDLLPVRIEMCDFDAEYQRDGERLGGVLGYAERWLKSRELVLHTRLRAIAATGRLLFLIDGFDEVRISRRRRFYAEMLLLFWRSTGCRMIVTSRTAGAEELRTVWPDLPAFALEEFDDTQVQRFLEAWHQMIFRDEHNKRDSCLARIVHTLELNRPVREVGRNPLLLTLLCVLNRRHELPRRRHQVFQRVIELLASQWEANKDLPPCTHPEFDLDDKLLYLRKLAWSMQQDQWKDSSGNRIAADDLERFSSKFGLEQLGLEPDAARRWSERLLADLSTRNQVLCSQREGHFGFLHRALLEHLAAEGAIRFLPAPQLVELFRLHWRDESWREVLTLCCGLLDDWNRQAMIVSGLQVTLSDVPLYFGDRQWRAHFAAFAIRCLTEVRHLRQEPTQSLTDLVMRLLHQDALAVAHTGMWWFGDAEVVDALHYFGPRWPQGDAWLDWALREDWCHEADRYHAWPARCVLATSTINERVPRLLSLLTEKTSYFLMQEASLLGPWTVQDAIELCQGLNSADEMVHVHVGCELAASAAPPVVEALLKGAIHDRIRIYLARDSRRSKDPEIERMAWQTLLDLTGSCIARVRWHAVEWVSPAVSHEAVRSRLCDLANRDADERVRFAAAHALLQSKSDTERARAQLRALTGAEDSVVRFWLGRVFASHADCREDARLLFEGLLTSKDPADRRWAVQELVEAFPDARTESLLLRCLDEVVDDTRWIHWPPSLLLMEALFDHLFHRWMDSKHYHEFNQPLISMTHFNKELSALETVRRKVEFHLNQSHGDYQTLNLASWLCHHGLEPQAEARERLHDLAREAQEDRVRLEAANRVHDTEMLLALARTTQDSDIQGEAVSAYAYHAQNSTTRRTTLLDLSASASTPAGRLAAIETLTNVPDDSEVAAVVHRALLELADAPDEWVRLQAAERLMHRSTLVDLAKLATNPSIRQRAADDLSILDLRDAILLLSSTT